MYVLYVKSGGSCSDCDTAKALLRDAGEEFVAQPVSSEVLRSLVPGDPVDNASPASSLRFPQVRHATEGWVGGLENLREILGDPLLRPKSSGDDGADENDKYVFDSPHAWAVDMYDAAQASFWLTKEIRLTDDVTHWRTQLDEDTREWLKHILGFFAAADGVVAESLADRYRQVQDPAVRAFLGYQLYNEQVHAQTYATILKTLVANPAERRTLLDRAIRMPHIRDKTEWSKRWIMGGGGGESGTSTDTPSFACKTVAYACVELIFFSSSFCSIFYIRKTGVLPGLCLSNEFIARDEGMHGDFACLLYRALKRPLPVSTVTNIVDEAVRLEKRFVRDSLRVDRIGMKSELLCEHVEFMGDRVLQQLGYPKRYFTKSPYMDLIERQSMAGQTNFFERTVSEYSRGTLMDCDEFGDAGDI